MQISKARLEAFSDGVMAIIITIMVLELKTPHSSDWEAIKPLIPVLISYVLSFLIIGIYWGNHHHLVHTVQHVNAKIIWANLHFLFWLSLIPFATAWIGENSFERVAVIVYAGLMAICGLAYFILLNVIMGTHTNQSKLLEPLQKQAKKGTVSFIAYLMAIPAAFAHPYIAGAIFILVGVIWIIPDRNIEKSIKDNA